MKRLVAASTAAVLLFGVSASAVSSATAYKPVVIAYGWSPSDVGTAAPLAASLGGSVLYANKKTLGDPTVDALRQLKPSEVVLVGGTKVLTSAIVTELGEVVPDVPVTRLEGEDRIHTAALGALYALGSAAPVVTDTGAASEAATGPGNALDLQNGYSESRFRVGTDLLPGVWQYYDYRGRSACRVGYPGVIERGVAVNGVRASTVTQGSYEHFGLIEGDIVTLQAAAGNTCTIERVRD